MIIISISISIYTYLSIVVLVTLHIGLQYRTASQSQAISSVLARDLNCALDDLICLQKIDVQTILAKQGTNEYQISLPFSSVTQNISIQQYQSTHHKQQAKHTQHTNNKRTTQEQQTRTKNMFSKLDQKKTSKHYQLSDC